MRKPHHTKYLIASLALAGVLTLVGSVRYYGKTALSTFAAGASPASTVSSLGSSGSTSGTTGTMGATTVTANHMTDLLIRKKGIGNVAHAGTGFGYMIGYANNGGISVTGIIITDTLPAGETYVGGFPAASSVSGSTVIWNIPTVAAHGSAIINFTVHIASSVASGTLITNRSNITGNVFDFNPTNNTGTATTLVIH